MTTSARIPRALPATGLALVALHALALHLLPALPGVAGTPFARAWGFNAWRYAPAWTEGLAYLAAALVLLPPVNELLARAVRGPARAALLAAARRPGIAASAICLGAMALFWAFRQKYGFLGDGYLLASQVEEGHAGFPHAGALRLAIWIHRALHPWKIAGTSALQITSVLSGGGFVLLALRLAAGIRRVSEGPWWVAPAAAAWILAVGPLQYFFGYMELYAPLATLLVAFLAAGFASLERGRPPLLATALVLGGAILHVLALASAPALVALWWVHLRRSRPRAARALLALSAAGCVAALAAYRALPLFRSTDRFWLPLTAGKEKLFTLFSGAHAAEVANAQMLGAPLAWPLIAFGLVLARRRGERLDGRVLVLSVLAATLLAGSFLFDFSLGARDWDLQAFSGVPLAILAAEIFFRWTAPALPARGAAYVALAATLLSGLAVAAWVGVNHTEASRRWVEDALATDPNDYYRDKPPALALASMYGSAGLPDAALDVSVHALEAHPNDTRILFNAGFSCQQMGRFAEAASYFDQACRAAPGYPPPHKGLFICYEKMGRYPEALAAARSFFAAGGSELEIFGRAAGMAFSLCRFDESAAILDLGLRAYPGDKQLATARRMLDVTREIAARLPPGTSLGSPGEILAAADARREAGARRDAGLLYQLAGSVGADSTRVRAGLASLGGR